MPRKHVKVYMDYFGYGIDDVIMCEYCGCRRANSIHHIKYRSQGGGNKIENLMALCVIDHDKAHNSDRAFNEELKQKHLKLIWKH